MPIIQSTPETEPTIIYHPNRIRIPEVLHSRLPRSIHELESTPDGANLVIQFGHSVKEWLHKQLYGEYQETIIPLDTHTTIHTGMYRFDVIGPDIDSEMKQLFQPREIKKIRGVYTRQATISHCQGTLLLSHASFLDLQHEIRTIQSEHRHFHESRGEPPCPINVIRELGTLVPFPPATP